MSTLSAGITTTATGFSASSTEYCYDSECRLVSATTPDARVEFGMRTGGRPPGRAYTGCTSRVR
ncbi:TPA: hypothetical protein JK826_000732 [Salmonella enterica]|nr:hypothetical protein [Salmonella enterica]HAV9258740.1 hypothetical protein [Salmonella enterica]